MVTAYRQLQAYLEAQSNYFVDTGGSVAPVWLATDKIQVSVSASWDDDVFIASSLNALNVASRHDKVTSQAASVVYKPTRALALNFTYRYEQRNSTDPFFKYDDKIAAVGVTFKWGRYPSPP
jgi:hypothetical protein